MRVIKTINKLCLCCMEEHEVKIVEVSEKTTFKGKKVEYTATYEYCDVADEYLSTEEMIISNDIAMKNAYREASNLLTNKKIIEIRNKYSMSQKDLACLLGWGEKTITRYEGHQVQDMAHDAVLRKIDEDPEWFLQLLEQGKDRIPQEAYKKYKVEISKEYEIMQDAYLRKSIQAQYTKYQDKPEYSGNTKLDFNKIVDTIRYYANSPKVNNLYKIKLMKMLWYADFLSYKRYNRAITGLVYTAMPMGALPIAHKSIVELKGITYDEVDFGNGSGYKFVKNNCTNYEALSQEDRDVLNTVIQVFGKSSKEQIVDKMHTEVAYKETKAGNAIDYKYAKDLDIA